MAVSKKGAYSPHNLQWFNRLLRHTFGLYLRHRYRLRCSGQELFDTLKPPYVVLPNHVAILDPFMVGYFVPDPVYWIASDSNMRTTILRMLLKLVGTIPKSKYIPDLETINAIVTVIRKRKGVVGIFPEGTASFDGTNLEIVPATGKLLKLLKVPVVTAIIKGGYYTMPRWSWRQRRGSIEVAFRLALDAAEVRSLAPEEIVQRIQSAIEHDEARWNQQANQVFTGRKLAENLETVLFQCPACLAYDSMHSSDRRFFCSACDYSVTIDGYGRLSHNGGMNHNDQPNHDGRQSAADHAASIASWSAWQDKAFSTLISDRVAKDGQSLLFTDAGVLVMRGRKLNPLQRFGTGQLSLYPDRIELALRDGQTVRFPLAETEGEGIFKRNIFEFYWQRVLYQIHFPSRHPSARKWLLAVQTLTGRSTRSTTKQPV
jgi:1-acyl-sn-glycerol-3-phosphate acyltransferase